MPKVIFTSLPQAIPENSNTIIPCTKLLIDFENRHIFFITNRTYVPQEATLFRIQSRLGWAHTKRFTGIATWFMLQLKYYPSMKLKQPLCPYIADLQPIFMEIGTNSVDYFIKLMVHI